MFVIIIITANHGLLAYFAFSRAKFLQKGRQPVDGSDDMSVDLVERLASRGGYAEADAARVMRQVATALQHVHSKRTLHRDLKVCMPPQRLQLRVEAARARLLEKTLQP